MSAMSRKKARRAATPIPPACSRKAAAEGAAGGRRLRRDRIRTGRHGNGERIEFLEELGLHETGLARVIRAGYELLHLHHLLHRRPQGSARLDRAQGRQGARMRLGKSTPTSKKASSAPKPSPYDDYVTLGGEAGGAEAGKLRAEGKEYVVQDGERILSGDYEIWSEEKLQRWSSAQGLLVTTDDRGAGLQYRRAAIISPPGITFTLKRPVTEKGSEFANGWVLNLDLAAIRARNGEQLHKARSLYSNLLQFDVIVDGELYTTVRQGAKKSVDSPLRLPIPHIRSNEGIVRVELRLANHPRNFLFLYDAYLTR
jgi:hypothetical protein